MNEKLSMHEPAANIPSRRAMLAASITAVASLCVGDPSRAVDMPATTQSNVGSSTRSSEKTRTLPDGLKITDTGAPSPAAKTGDTVWVHYILKLKDGTEIDNSYKRGDPIQVTIGAGQVIKGWEEGLVGMEVGGKRKLEIPPDLAYGAEGRPPQIPQNATLYFDVELMGLKR